MAEPVPPDALAALAQYVLGEVTSCVPLDGGHIHATYLVQLREAGQPRSLVLQRFNSHVFGDVVGVMENIVRVTEHVRAQLVRRGVRDLERRVLSVRRSLRGEHYVRSADGVFRVFDYVPNSVSLRRVDDPQHAFAAGQAFGAFAGYLSDFPAPPLHATIPGFHATAARLAALRAAVTKDTEGRAAAVAKELAFIEARESLAGECALLAGQGVLPERVTHNDAKLANVLFDAVSGEVLCVVDLDTVMPGYLAYDFGDLVRTTACVGDEDSRELSQVGLDLARYEALVRGYLGAAAPLLAAGERETLVLGAYWIILELAMRFLTDYLEGDLYFKTTRVGQNLDRARVQLRLLAELERQRDAVLGGYETLCRSVSSAARGA